MKNKSPTYSCFSEKGEDYLPDESFIEECYQQGIKPIIFLDSCVCLHIIKVVDYGKLAKNIDLKKIIILKTYLAKHPDIRIDPFFGFLELCSRNGVLDLDKLQDFKYRIDFFEQISLKTFKRFKYDFHKDFFVFKKLSVTKGNPLEAIEPTLKNSYCTLLKIRSIALQGLTKNRAKNNVNTFLNWMVNELNIFRGVEYKLAMNIFGGNTVFRKMIGLDCKQSDTKKKLLGTCWDIFHSKYTSNNFRLFQLLEKNIYSYFLTSDANLFNIFQNLSLKLVKDGGDNFISSFILTSDFSYPHFEKSFIDENNKIMINLFINRHRQEYHYNENKIDRLIKSLELENGIST